jgi:uroporphyrinogen-III synthase
VSTPSSESDRVLAGKVIAVPETRQLDVLAGLLERRGAHVLRCPLVGIVDAPDAAPIVAWIERLIAQPTDLVVFYTGEGIERLLGFARRASLEAPFVAALKRIPKLTRGPKPKRALRELGLAAEYSAAEPTTTGLVAAARTIPVPVRRVAIQLYSENQDLQLRDDFEQRGIDTDCVAPYVYASAADDDRVVELIGALADGAVAAIAFTSKAQVARLQDIAHARGLTSKLRAGLERTRVAAIGPVVNADLEAAGIRVDAMPVESYSMKPLVTSLCELLGSRS